MFMKKGGEGRPKGAMPTVKKIAGCIRVFAKWLFIGSVVGILVGTVSALFGRALGFANAFRAAHPRMLLALPAAGLVIAFLYRSFLHSGDRGTNLVIASIHSSADIPFRTAPLIFVSTVLTQLCGGSAGREGAAIQLGGGLSAGAAGGAGGCLRDGGAVLRGDQLSHQLADDCL